MAHLNPCQQNSSLDHTDNFSMYTLKEAVTNVSRDLSHSTPFNTHPISVHVSDHASSTDDHDNRTNQFTSKETRLTEDTTTRLMNELEEDINSDSELEMVLNPRPLPFLTTNNLTFRLTKVISPTHFFVHADDELSSQLNSLSARLNSLYRNSTPFDHARPSVGSFWVIKERAGEKWSRVRVTELDVDTKTVGVLSVDYGDTDTVLISELRPLFKEIADTPCLAIRCRLGGIYPSERKNSEVWSDDATKKFLELIGGNRPYQALVQSTLDKNGELSLIVFEDDDDQKLTINETLIAQGVASSDVFHVEAEPKIVIPEDPVPAPGSTLTVRVVSVVVQPFRVYVAPVKVGKPTTFHTLQKSLQEEYSTNYDRHRISSMPNFNEVVVARSSNDGLWYRGQVTNQQIDDCIYVFFVDVGITEAIQLRNLCRCLSSFARVPKQVLGVYLNGVDRYHSRTKNGLQLVNDLVQNKDLVAKIITVWPDVCVELSDTSGPAEIDIVKELIASNAVKLGSKSYITKLFDGPLNVYPG